MSKETYNIATNPKPSYDFQKDVISLCILRAITWGIADEKINNITTLSTDYELKYNVANNRSTQSPARFMDSGERLIDLFNHHLLNNDAIVPEDKKALHIHLTGGGEV